MTTLEDLFMATSVRTKGILSEEREWINSSS